MGEEQAGTSEGGEGRPMSGRVIALRADCVDDLQGLCVGLTLVCLNS